MTSNPEFPATDGGFYIRTAGRNASGNDTTTTTPFDTDQSQSGMLRGALMRAGLQSGGSGKSASEHEVQGSGTDRLDHPSATHGPEPEVRQATTTTDSWQLEQSRDIARTSTEEVPGRQMREPENAHENVPGFQFPV